MAAISILVSGTVDNGDFFCNLLIREFDFGKEIIRNFGLGVVGRTYDGILVCVGGSFIFDIGRSLLFVAS